MLGLEKYLTAVLGSVAAALTVILIVMGFKLSANTETIKGLRAQLAAETSTAVACAGDMEELRYAVDEANEEIARNQEQAAAALAAQAEADRFAGELARAESRIGQINAERESFRARLAELPRCEKYRETLIEIAAGGGP